jgi:predicted amidohydrolase
MLLTNAGCRNNSQAYAMESQSFVLHTTQVLTDDGVALMGTKGAPIMGEAVQGSSAVIGPDGRILSKLDSPNEKLIIADLDLTLVTKCRTFADASGSVVSDSF